MFHRGRAQSLGLLLTAAIGLVSALVAVAPACSGKQADEMPIDLLPDDGGIRGLSALRIDPASATLSLVPGGTATTTFKAMGTLSDGTTRDVTDFVSWNVGLSSASVAGGKFSTTNGGLFTVTAQSGAVIATATVKVTFAGDLFEGGFDPTKKDKLGGSPTASAAPTVVYPIANSLFPANLAPVDVQLRKASAGQKLARFSFKVTDVLDVNVFTTCGPIDGAADGCSLILSEKVCTMLAEASDAGPLTTSLRLAADDGSSLGETTLGGTEWTRSRLTGGLYYWTTIRAATGDKTAISRFDLDSGKFTPETYWTNDDSPPLASGEKAPCAGCHAVSRDGTKLALTFGGSDASDWELVDVAKKSSIATRNTDPKGFATFTTFSPDGARLATSFRGKLTLRVADATAADQGTLFADVTEAKTQPFWSPDGRFFTFVSWEPGKNGASDSTNGDIERGGQIWIAPADGKGVTGKASLLVPRETGKTSYYPAISDDGAFVVFNKSSCDGPARTAGYGPDACDGYDDASARVWLVGSGGGPQVELTKLDGPETWTNSWPRFSPDHGNFRGRSIYWIAYSSRRPYGLRLAGSTKGETSPQLWFSAVTVEAGKVLSGDPSFGPVWLPGQNSDMSKPTGNHVPQWAAVSVPRAK